MFVFTLVLVVLVLSLLFVNLLLSGVLGFRLDLFEFMNVVAVYFHVSILGIPRYKLVLRPMPEVAVHETRP